jgi:acyl carrier protein
MDDVLRPKVAGTWALHRALESVPLDFFVMFSSATHQLGLLGQGVAAYSAANAFLDALAHWRRGRDLPGLSICWGPWATVGMAAQTGNDQRLRGFGIEGIAPDQGLRAVGHLLGSDRAEAWVLPVEWAKLFEADADLKSTPFVSELASADAGQESEEVLARRAELLGRLGDAPGKLRQKLLVEHIQDHVVDVMRLESREAVDWRRGLFDIGMDSLMALELKSRLQTSLGVPIPSTLAFTYPDVHAMAGYLLTQLFPSGDVEDDAASDTDVEERLATVATQIEGLDDAEMETLLARKLETL